MHSFGGQKPRVGDDDAPELGKRSRRRILLCDEATYDSDPETNIVDSLHAKVKLIKNGIGTIVIYYA